MASEWLRADEAAAYLRTTVANVWVIAHRREWRTVKQGRTVTYHIDDVADEVERRHAESQRVNAGRRV